MGERTLPSLLKTSKVTPYSLRFYVLVQYINTLLRNDLNVLKYCAWNRKDLYKCKLCKELFMHANICLFVLRQTTSHLHITKFARDISFLLCAGNLLFLVKREV